MCPKHLASDATDHHAGEVNSNAHIDGPPVPTNVLKMTEGGGGGGGGETVHGVGGGDNRVI